MNYRHAAMRPDERLRQNAAGKDAVLAPAIISPSKYIPTLETPDCGAAKRRIAAQSRKGNR
jgi:hypothetical protein